MRDAPEIAPEIRGLLAELVADPRSSLRLVPKRPLRHWFDGGETVRARDVSGTKLERHLIDAHREELAQLLFEAAIISYWKAPVLADTPVDADGNPYNPADGEPRWRAHAGRLDLSQARSHDEATLARCLECIPPADGGALAAASLSLVPSDSTRWQLALGIPWTRPRTAVRLLERLIARHPARRMHFNALLSLGARLCSLERLAEARAAYRSALRLEEGSVSSACYAFNMSLFLGDERAAIEDARRVAHCVKREEHELREVRRIIKQWSTTKSPDQLRTVTRMLESVSKVVPSAVASLKDAYPR